MRISDWSSDVCSSDLKGGSLQAVGDPLDGPSPSAASNSAPTEIAPAPGEMAEIAPHLTHAMARLAERESSSADAGISQLGGFEASVHKIKEQVLPRLLERVDPEAAASLSKDELTEEFRPIIGEVLAELKLSLNLREQIALETVLA